MLNDSFFVFFSQLSPLVQAIIATTFTWGVTAIGASGIFFLKTINQKVLSALLGFAAGVMIAASFWSLLAPSIEMSDNIFGNAWAAPMIGFLLGGAFLYLIDKLLPHLHPGLPKSQAEGVKTSWQKTLLLFTAITLHNFPEGLAIGVAFGALGAGFEGASLAGAMALALGIGIQNFPEGFAVSVPFRREGKSKFTSFMYGQASALVEPIAAILGVIAVSIARPLLPYALAFAAGAMVYVSAEEIIPESRKNSDIATIGLMIGFAIMMVLDVALG